MSCSSTDRERAAVFSGPKRTHEIGSEPIRACDHAALDLHRTKINYEWDEIEIKGG